MDTGRIESTIRAIAAKDIRAAGEYHALPDDARKEVLGALDSSGLRSLTRLIKNARKKRFEAADERVLECASGAINTPVYLLDETLIEENMRVMRYVKDRTGCKMLHALKAYASFATFPTMSKYLDGTAASGVNEARLGHEAFKKEVHTFGAAYKEKELRRLLRYSDSIVFNSFYQLGKYGEMARKAGVETGVRVNPGYSEVATEIYNPCAPYSRLGITHEIFAGEFPRHAHMVDGLHFHAMCEQNSDVLERILRRFEKLYGTYIGGLRWVNFGGGHLITRDDYDVERLVRLINAFKAKYDVQVYLEPGESSVYNGGVLISSVLDIVRNEMEIAIMDASAETHMPDVLLMPYRPHIMGSARPHESELHLQGRGTKLPRGGCDGRLFLRPAPQTRRQAGFYRHGPLQHSEEHYLQRNNAPGYRGGEGRGADRGGEEVRL